MATDTFPVLPATSQPVSPDEFLRTEGLMSGQVAAPTPRQPLTVGTTPAIDFAQRRFIPSTAGGPLIISGREALRQWCEMCLRTRRGENAALDKDFGVDKLFTDLIGGNIDPGALAEFEGIAERALLTNPLIAALEDWEPVIDEASQSVTFYYTVVFALEGEDPLDLSDDLSNPVG